MNSFWDVMSVVGSLLLIVGILVFTWYATRWYARRMGAGGAGKYLKVLDRVTLGGTASLVVVQVGEKHLLLGVGDKQVQLLCELEDFESYLAAIPEPTGQVPFGQLLKGIMEKTGRPGESGKQGGKDEE